MGNRAPRVRESQPREVEAIAAIYAIHVRTGTASFELQPPDAAEIARRRQAVLDAGHPYLVAERGTTLLGYAYAAAYRMRPAYRWCVEDSVYVDPQAFGGGVGSALLGALVAESAARGRRQMIAVIGGSAHLASIRLHEKHGFVHAGTLRAVGFKHGSWHDTVMMQRALGAGDSSPPDTDAMPAPAGT